VPNLIVAQAEITPDLPIAIAPKFLEMFWDRNQGKLFLNATSARHVSAHLLTIVADEKLAEQVAMYQTQQPYPAGSIRKKLGAPLRGAWVTKPTHVGSKVQASKCTFLGKRVMFPVLRR